MKNALQLQALGYAAPESIPGKFYSSRNPEYLFTSSAEKISAAKTIEELCEAVLAMKVVKYSGERSAVPGKVAALIMGVIAGRLPENVITRNYGLRRKLRELAFQP